MIANGEWSFTKDALHTFLASGIVLEDLPVPMGGEDYKVWTPHNKGQFSVSSAKEIIRKRQPILEGAKLLWRPAIHPSLAARNCKLLRGACATLDKAWLWIADVFGIFPHQNLTTAYKEAKGKSRMFKDLWLLAILVVRSELWMTRNGMVIKSQDDLRVLAYFRVQYRRVKISDPKECYWVPPEVDELQLCCDGASRGNPGRACAGVVVRDSEPNVLEAMSVGFWVRTNYLAELFCIIVALEWANKFGVGDICIRTDSMGADQAYSSDTLAILW
ncbi:uncharacterized protein LOC113316092 [Papaver somniferum]|uniref:uncharacterized protein LOC113316092 n=1 Tax=Papaver somniferum TaxID=3469 RepID=UPI000E6F6DC5|nr:uncharacterized protein LOC113316092 [Papaver somniferum]